MKTIKTLAYLFALSFIVASCSQKSMTVATDRNLQQGEFDEYQTFTFASHIEEADNNNFFWDSELMKMAVRNEVQDELAGLGYKYVEGEDADLLVNFRVFEDNTEFTGWTDNYADQNYWGTMELRKEAIGLQPSAEVREPGDAETYYLDKGTIFVQMADMDKSVVVWQGYASGIVENASILDDDEEKIEEAVELLFDEYNFSAAGYVSK
ncbi:MAG: DUF4136 domain-containing protein [Candidatus Cyclobacteriaceae bacterium M3_2C_046]